MINKETFAEVMKIALKEALGGQGHLEVKDVLKNNGVIQTGIVIREKGRDMAPVIYVDALYEAYKEGYSVETLVAEVFRKMKKENEKLAKSRVDFMNYEEIKDKIILRLVNYDRNKELLTDLPHKKFLNLAIVFRLYLGEEDDHQVTSQVTWLNMRQWDVSVDEIYKQALKNSARLQPVRHAKLSSVLFGLEEDDEMDGILPELYLMTNASGIDGASTILYPNELKQVSEKFGTDVVILPSSIHESLLLKYDESMDMGYFGEMVKTINKTDVRAQEVLSDSVYIYRRKTNVIEVAETGQVAAVA